VHAAMIIAAATFREAIRARVFVYLLVVVACMVAGSFPAAQLSFGEHERIIVDVAMGAISFIAIFLALFFGVSGVSGEIERRTIYALIAKPVSRREFVCGKFLGVWFTVTVAVCISYLILFALIFLSFARLPSEIFLPWFMALFEMGLLVAVATFFSCMTRPLLSSLFALALYAVGTSLHSILYWVGRSTPSLASLSQFFYYLLPNFELFDVKAEVVYHLHYPSHQLLFCAAYALVYMAILVWGGSFILDRRDLK